MWTLSNAISFHNWLPSSDRLFFPFNVTTTTSFQFNYHLTTDERSSQIFTTTSWIFFLRWWISFSYVGDAPRKVFTLFGFLVAIITRSRWNRWMRRFSAVFLLPVTTKSHSELCQIRISSTEKFQIFVSSEKKYEFFTLTRDTRRLLRGLVFLMTKTKRKTHVRRKKKLVRKWVRMKRLKILHQKMKTTSFFGQSSTYSIQFAMKS